MEQKLTHFLHVPWTGLGRFNGFRGNRWLKNRIKIFKQFVIPSIQAQSNKNFILWCAWRHEEKSNPYVKELQEYLEGIIEFKTVFTFSGICFWDDKYEYEIARTRLIDSLMGAMGDLLNYIPDGNEVLMTIQPSDDIYHSNGVQAIQDAFKDNNLDAVGFSKGYICDYLTKTVAEYNPETNPPFYTIKFTKEVFSDPLKHLEFTSIKKDVNQYKAGTPIPSHEYPIFAFGKRYGIIKERGFLVGCHSDNISTFFNIPYKGKNVDTETLKQFGIYDIPVLKVKTNIGRVIMRALPHKIRRKLRYWRELLSK